MHLQKSPKIVHFLIFDFESNFLVKFCQERRLIGTYSLNVATSIFLPHSVATCAHHFPINHLYHLDVFYFSPSKDSQKKHWTRAMIDLKYQVFGISLNCNFFFAPFNNQVPINGFEFSHHCWNFSEKNALNLLFPSLITPNCLH
jgi:hypothetical protein